MRPTKAPRITAQPSLDPTSHLGGSGEDSDGERHPCSAMQLDFSGNVRDTKVVARSSNHQLSDVHRLVV